MTMKAVGWCVAVVAVIVAGWLMLRPGAPGAPTAPKAGLHVPRLSGAALEGERLFAANCASCHGENAGGTDIGPSLVQRIYAPAHHADLAFRLAVRNGVRAHHWTFGNMPPVEGVGTRDVDRITAYVRSIQRANGIE